MHTEQAAINLKERRRDTVKQSKIGKEEKENGDPETSALKKRTRKETDAMKMKKEGRVALY